MSEFATVVVIGGDEPERVCAALRAEGISAVAVDSQTGVQALIEGLGDPDAAKEKDDWVVLADGDLPDEFGFELHRLLHRGKAVPTLTLVAAENYDQFARDPRRAPLDEFAAKPLRIQELVLRVKALMLRAGFDLPPPPDGEEVTQRREDEPSGTVIVVAGAKGGIGRTTVAVNLADGLVRFHGRKTLLVDADVLFGDVGVLLNVESSKSLSDVCFGGDVDILRLQSALVPIDSGLSVLLRPRELWVAEGLAANTIVQAILTYKGLFDYVVVDTANTLDPVNLQLFQSADHVLFVTTPEITSILHTARLLDVADSLGCKDRIKLILNRAGSGVPLGAIESQLGVGVVGDLVSAGRAVVDAANRGETLFAHDPRAKSEIARQMRAIVDSVAQLDTAGAAESDAPRPMRPEGRGLLSFLGVKR